VNPFLDYSLDLTQTLPLESAGFDTVLLTDVLEHIPEPAALMREIGRLLRPSGTLILGVPFFYGIHEEPYDYYRYTEFALRRFCDLNGLAVAELEPYGGLPEIVFDLVSRAIDFLPARLSGALIPVHAFAARLCDIPLGRKISRVTSAAFPLGYVMAARKS
jgi:SAM-dependent methyltransferase